MGLLDLIFPKYCVNCQKLGAYLCTDCFSYLSFDTQGHCLVCGRPAIDGYTHPACLNRYTIDGSFTAIAYKGVARKLIFQFKYKPYLADLRTVLGELFLESLSQNEGFQKVLQEKPIIIPIPLHSSRLKSRGYNHAGILAEDLSKRLHLLYSDMIQRTKKTKSQFGLDRKKRKENLKGAFVLSPNISQYLPAGRQVLLVDDILTTGTTLLEAARVLKKAGAKKVWGITLAQD